MPRLDFFSLKTRIGLGFTFICILLGIVGLASYVGLERSEKHFSLFSGLSSQANLHVEIGRNVSEIQRHAQRFTYEGHGTAENKVYSLYEVLRNDLRIAEKSVTDRETRKIIDKMIEHLGIYMNTFKQVVIERKLESDLVQKSLRENAEKSENQLEKYIQLHTEQNEAVHASEANLLLHELLRIEKNAFRYFDTLDSTLIKKTKINFNNLYAGIKKLKGEENESEHMKFLNGALLMVSEYEKMLLRAVQATRAYLYLVNVVMAGEASEFLYNANKLKDHAAVKMESVQQQVFQLVKRTNLITSSMTIGALLLGIIMSWLIGKSITTPLERMTSTFRLLASGDHSSQIPGHDFRDEIGELSRAAGVFKEKNRQTESLLKKTQSLAKELEDKRKELARSNAELEQFVYTVSHDLKSPLVTSMGFIGMINDLAKKGEYGKAISKLDRIVQSNKRMGQLINDLLELSRVGRVDMDKKDLDMNLLLNNFKGANLSKLKDEGFELILETDFPVISANESRVLQIFENLMSNAFKYAINPEGSVVRIGCKEVGSEYLFYVRDNGQGIPKEYHEKIFGLFYRLDTAMKGTGIGLAVARKVMQFHEGRVWVESEPGKGATFWVAFPISKKHQA